MSWQQGFAADERPGSHIELKIFVATHRPAPFPDDPGYIPIQSGKALSSPGLAMPGLDMLGDDSGDNISVRNPIYSELCVLYWMAHNVDAKRVGLAHYRRYFSPVDHSVRVAEHDVASSSDFAALATVHLIVPEPMDLAGVTTWQQYADSHYERDLVLARGAVAKLSPDYVPAFETVMQTMHLTPYNMFVGRSPVVRA